MKKAGITTEDLQPMCASLCLHNISQADTDLPERSKQERAALSLVSCASTERLWLVLSPTLTRVSLLLESYQRPPQDTDERSR